MTLENSGSTQSVAEYLADELGEPIETFEYVGEIPNADNQEWVAVNEPE